MRRIATSIDIAAPPAAVWQVLADFARWGEWNAFIPRLTGEPRRGARLDATIHPPGGAAFRVRPVIVDFEPESLLRWRGRFLVPYLVDGEHAFVLGPAPGGTRFGHAEIFSGLLVPFMGGMLDRTERGFIAFNEALKRRVESAA